MIPALTFIVAAYCVTRLLGLVVHEIRAETVRAGSAIVIAVAVSAMVLIAWQAAEVFVVASDAAREQAMREYLRP